MEALHGQKNVFKPICTKKERNGLPSANQAQKQPPSTDTCVPPPVLAQNLSPKYITKSESSMMHICAYSN